MIDDLKYFQYNEFTPAFLAQMKEETNLVMKHIHNDTTYDYDWDPESKRFNESLERANARRRQQQQDEANDPVTAEGTRAVLLSRERHYRTWKDTPSECARRVWLQWSQKLRQIGDRVFPRWTKALRLCALVRVSSAAVERVFSHLKRLIELLGHRCLGSTLETRMRRRMNESIY